MLFLKSDEETMTNIPVETSIMSELRERTREEHVSAERHPLQQQLFRGSLPRRLYIAHLEQLFLVHRALDSALQTLRRARPELVSLLEDWQFQTPYLREDLHSFGVDPEAIVGLPATRRLITEIQEAEKSSDVCLLGFHYVLEGSNNGSRIIAKKVRGAYDLSGSLGTRYLDPYGEEQGSRWQAFKSCFDALIFSPAERKRIIDAAKSMFQAITDISTELLATPAPEEAAGKH
jgi:heme oxygenase